MKNQINIPAESFNNTSLHAEEQPGIDMLNSTLKSNPVRNILFLVVYLVVLFYIVIGALA